MIKKGAARAASSLYLPSGYIDEAAICESQDTFIFQVGPRGTGKSYGIMQWLIQAGKRFLMLRRTGTEAEAICSAATQPFKVLDLPGTAVNVSSAGKNLWQFTVTKEGKQPDPAGYLAALSTFATVKGVDFSQIEVIFYDEFIPEKHQRPIRDEYLALMNLYETVNRNRELQGKPPVKLICAANSVDIANPIFIGLEVVEKVARMMKKGTEVYRDRERRMSVYMFMNSPISGQKAETALYQLTAGQSFQDMALRNLFDLDSRYIRSLPLRELVPVVRVGELVIYKHKSRPEYYARCGSAGTVPVTYTGSDTDRKRFQKRYAILYLKYMAGRVFFETHTAQVLFERLYS